MAGEKTFICATCGIQKRVANRWFVTWKIDGVLRFAKFTYQRAGRKSSMCLCGEGCAHKLLSQELSALEAPDPIEASAEELPTESPREEEL